MNLDSKQHVYQYELVHQFHHHFDHFHHAFASSLHAPSCLLLFLDSFFPFLLLFSLQLILYGFLFLLHLVFVDIWDDQNDIIPSITYKSFKATGPIQIFIAANIWWSLESNLSFSISDYLKFDVEDEMTEEVEEEKKY